MAHEPAGPAASDGAPTWVALDHALDADRIAAVGRALSEPVRVRLLDVLRRSPEPLCQCELRALLDGMSQPSLSQHLSKLVAAGLVDVERRHRWAYYSAAAAGLAPAATWMNG